MYKNIVGVRLLYPFSTDFKKREVLNSTIYFFVCLLHCYSDMSQPISMIPFFKRVLVPFKCYVMLCKGRIWARAPTGVLWWKRPTLKPFFLTFKKLCFLIKLISKYAKYYQLGKGYFISNYLSTTHSGKSISIQK